MGTRVKNFNSTGVAPNGILYAGDLNAIEDQYADLFNLGQAVGVSTLAIGESGLQLLRYGAGEARLSGALRTDGILRALGGLYAGAFTTAQRNAIASGSRPYGLVILNTDNNRLEWNQGTDASPSWVGLSAGISRGSGAPPAAGASNANALYFRTDLNGGTLFYSDGSVWTKIAPGLSESAIGDGTITWAKIDTDIPNPLQMYDMMMVEGVLPHVDYAGGNPQTGFQVSGASAWDVSVNQGRALIQGDDTARQGMYYALRSVAANFTLPTHAPGSNSRWDIIALQFNDADFTGRTPLGAQLIQVVGTASSQAAWGANYTGNYTGLPALPNSAIPLAYVLIASTDGAINTGRIEDRRKLAGPGIWGEDGHRYRLSVDNLGRLGTESVV